MLEPSWKKGVEAARIANVGNTFGKALKGVPKSEEWKAKARASWTPERRAAAAARMANNNRNPKGREPGFKQTNETRQKLSEARIGRVFNATGHHWSSAEYRQILRLRFRYKMTPEEYAAKLQKQGGHCALCPATLGAANRPLCVDHKHKCCPGDKSCGRCVRGLLCNDCNSAIERPDTLGIEWLDRARQYLLQYS